MKSLILILPLLAIFSCSRHQKVEVRDENGKITEEYHILKKTGKKEGEYLKRFQGKTIEVAYFNNDSLHGTRTIFTPEGIKEIEEHYNHGIYEGPYFSYYANGQVKVEGNYENGTMEGIWKKYYESGQLMETVSMHHNEENGPFVEYWENGNLKAEGNYLDGDNENGELKLYNEQGQLEKTMQCERGVCHTTWKRESNLIQ